MAHLGIQLPHTDVYAVRSRVEVAALDFGGLVFARHALAAVLDVGVLAFAKARGRVAFVRLEGVIRMRRDVDRHRERKKRRREQEQ